MYQFMCFLKGAEAEEAAHLSFAELLYEVSLLNPVLDPVDYDQMIKWCEGALIYTVFFLGCSWIVAYDSKENQIAIYYKIDENDAPFGLEMETYDKVEILSHCYLK